MTAGLPEGALVWDQTFPATPTCGSWPAHFAALERMRAAGYTAVSITVASDPDDTASAISRISFWRRHVAQHSDRYRLLMTAADAEAAQARGQLAIGFHFQGTTPFGRDPGLVEVFYRLGVRHALMAYNQKNHVGDGCHERTEAGLSRFGVELIAEMERVGMVVDCSHTGHATVRDVLEVATRPVIFSHSNAAALRSHQRNIPDDLARAAADTGGVVGICGIGIFLGDNDASTEALFAHLDHWVSLLGPRHVGIGLDSVSEPDVLTAVSQAQGAKYPPDQGYDTTSLKVSVPEQIPELAGRMAKAGYAEGDICAILGGNWLRLAREVWRDMP
ncbi:peptidase M19 [Rhodosalinus halophilus]|uniref:Peptidase M19 n=1 Tax=Rhodosalinus halophilus TaxID=2259333 RepID=A0A365U5U2_9RHOB|nr:membrane dipeptidase [Rhodosalinus halophilus]RBI83792.1 peptidase M19 [Rhodosalinus halophilus]